MSMYLHTLLPSNNFIVMFDVSHVWIDPSNMVIYLLLC